MTDRLVGPAVAAKLLGVHPRTLARWADRGLIHVVVLPSGQRRYRASDLAKVLRGRRTGTSPGARPSPATV